MKQLKLKPDLNVQVVSPYQTFFNGKAVSVQAQNSSGQFAILAGHANFFSLLTAGQVTIDTGYDRIQLYLERGIMRVSSDQVTLFANV